MVIANMEPFRGPSMDVGTAFEMGYATRADIPIFGYSSKVRNATVTHQNPGIPDCTYDKITTGGGTVQYQFGQQPQAQVNGDQTDPMTGLTYVDAQGLEVNGTYFAYDYDDATFDERQINLESLRSSLSATATRLAVTTSFEKGVFAFTAGTTLGDGTTIADKSAAIAQAIGIIDLAIDQVSAVRGKLGAMQANNLEVQADALRISFENLQAAESDQ